MLKVGRPALLRATVAMLAIAWAPETWASPDPAHPSPDAQHVTAARNPDSARAAEGGNSAGVPPGRAGRNDSVLVVQGATGGIGQPSEQESHWGERLSCELSSARLDIGLLQRIEYERGRAEGLEQQLAAARRDVETQAALATKAVEDAARVKQAAPGGAELQNALQQARERAGKLEQDLAAARRDVETQTALATKAGEEISRLKAGEGGAANLQASLQQAREQSARLEQDLAAARRNVETQTALATKAGEETSRLKATGEGGAAKLQASLQQEREQSARLERDLAAARRDLETQTALATKAGEEASRLKVAEEGTAKLQASLQQERERSARLDQDLAAARRDLEAHAALATKAGEEASRLKAAGESGTPDLQKERERSTRLEQDLTLARREVEAQTALAAKAGEEVLRRKLAVEAAAADLRQSRAKTDALAQELSQARSSIYAYEAQALKAGEEAAELRRAAESGAALAHKATPDEIGRLARLEQDLAAARRDVEAKTALVTQAGEQTSRLQAAGKSSAADLQKERERSARLEQDLAAARRDVETKTALVTQAGEQTSRLQAAAKSTAADLQKERERSGRLEQDLAAARRDVDSKTALVTKEAEETSRVQAAGKSAAADLQKERERSGRLEQDLAVARRDVESKTALVTKAAEEMSRLASAGKSGAADLQKERERSARLEQDLAAAHRDREVQSARATKASEEVLLQKQAAEAGAAELRQLRARADGRSQNPSLWLSAIHAYEAQARDAHGAASEVVATGSSAARDKSTSAKMAANPIAEQPLAAPARAVAQPAPEQAEEAAGLVARARSMLRQGDIGAARLVLERAVEMGSAQASFALAETYDPLILAKWGTYGTRGDARRARDLYANAEAAGVQEAKSRLEALRR
ncbi:hypothetical protein WDK88_35530 [Bradyrhizobium septentrionale]|uniref:Chromosome segregation ATPase n=1 Tax=Bradyrhizobium septentrionale TaxID=1404411 RepID=A0ABZ2NUS4_9BRAD